jgi:hypothetical protein
MKATLLDDGIDQYLGITAFDDVYIFSNWAVKVFVRSGGETAGPSRARQ